MMITFEMNGGFAHIPNLSQPTIIDTAQINPKTATQLESLVRESHFFDRPIHADIVPKGAADYRTYTITVKDDLHARTIQFTDLAMDVNLERLVSCIQAIIAHQSKP